MPSHIWDWKSLWWSEGLLASTICNIILHLPTFFSWDIRKAILGFMRIPKGWTASRSYLTYLLMTKWSENNGSPEGYHFFWSVWPEPSTDLIFPSKKLPDQQHTGRTWRPSHAAQPSPNWHLGSMVKWFVSTNPVIEGNLRLLQVTQCLILFELHISLDEHQMSELWLVDVLFLIAVCVPSRDILYRSIVHFPACMIHD